MFFPACYDGAGRPYRREKYFHFSLTGVFLGIKMRRHWQAMQNIFSCVEISEHTFRRPVFMSKNTYVVVPHWHTRGALTAVDDAGVLAEMAASLLQTRDMSPVMEILSDLHRSGRDVTAAVIEVEGLRVLARMLPPESRVTINVTL